MREAGIRLFILSPEFVAQKWPLKELRCFLGRDERCRSEGKLRSVLLPLFYRLSLQNCAECRERINGADSEYREVLRKNHFFHGGMTRRMLDKGGSGCVKGSDKTLWGRSSADRRR